ncbi:MAG: hypothetical protein IPJ65_03585 [Archangiaceae bacterium]|nr:hypothetical protein [Archangiaceae bacterium]
MTDASAAARRANLTPSRVVRFAPERLRDALEAATDEGVDADRLRALLPGLQDDFDSKAYVESIVARLTAPVEPPLAVAPEPTRTEGEPERDAADAAAAASAAEAARRRAELAEAADTIARATQLPPAHAQLFAEARYTVDQTRRAIAGRMPPGQALVLHKLGVDPEGALQVGCTGLPPRQVYPYVKHGVAPEHLAEAIEHHLKVDFAEGFVKLGFTVTEALALARVGLEPRDIPRGVGFSQLEEALARGVPLGETRQLIEDGTFSFEQACELLERVGQERAPEAKALALDEGLSFEALLARFA